MKNSLKNSKKQIAKNLGLKLQAGIKSGRTIESGPKEKI
jgi:hypothetical protein